MIYKAPKSQKESGRTSLAVFALSAGSGPWKRIAAPLASVTAVRESAPCVDWRRFAHHCVFVTSWCCRCCACWGRAASGRWWRFTTTEIGRASLSRWCAMRSGFIGRRRKRYAYWSTCASRTLMERRTWSGCWTRSHSAVTSASPSSCSRWTSMNSSRKTSSR